MKKPALILCAVAALLAACDGASAPAASNAAAVAVNAAAPAPAPPNFPALIGRVVDQADLLNPEQEARLAAASAALEREVGPQFVVVTVPSLQGLTIEEYGLRLGRAWGIGSRAHNDGLILLVAPTERKVRIEVGTGLERRVTDPFAAGVIRDTILPRFRANDLPGGIVAGSDALIARLRSRQSDREIATEDHLIT